MAVHYTQSSSSLKVAALEVLAMKNIFSCFSQATKFLVKNEVDSMLLCTAALHGGLPSTKI